MDLGFHYDAAFGGQAIPDAYERLLLDALNGDASLFTRSDEIEEAWEIIDPIIQGFAAPDAPAPAGYAIGSMGPDAADEFLAWPPNAASDVSPGDRTQHIGHPSPTR